MGALCRRAYSTGIQWMVCMAFADKGAEDGES